MGQAKKMANRTKFIGYLDWIDYAESMNDEELWKLFRKILQHENWVEEIELPLEFKFAWEKIKKSLDTNSDKREEKIENSSKWGKNHEWNQYTKWDDKRNSNDKAQKNTVGVMGVNGSVGSEWNISDIKNNNTISSSKKEKENRKEKERNEMLAVFRNDNRLIKFMEEEDVIRWWDFKQSSKKPYKNIKSFITALVKIKNKIAISNWRPKSDRNRRNRFNFTVNEAIDREREWLDRYDYMESSYESSKDDLYPNPKQNE